MFLSPSRNITGFFSYCGAQVIFEETINKMEITGSVSVGIAILGEKLNANFMNKDDISIDKMDAIIAEIRGLIAQIQELAKVN